MTAVDESAAPVPLRRNRDFLLLWTGNWLQFFGSRLSGVCYPLLALELSGNSASAAGLASVAAVLPYAIVQLPAGVLVDRWDRRRVMEVCAALRAVVLGAVAVTVLLGTLDLPWLLALIAADVALAILAGLAERASVLAIVPPSQLASALSQNEARGRSAGLLGGPLGTVLFSWVRWSPYLASAVGAAVAALNVRFVRADCRPTPKADAGEPRSVRRDLADGFTWIRRQPFLRVAIPLTSVAGGFLQLVSLALVVILVKEQGHDESTVGLLLGISGCGGVLGALTARWWTRRVPLSALLIGGFALWTVLMAGMSTVTGPVGLGVLFGAMNLVGAVFGVSAAVFQMTSTPLDLQGRVGATAGLVTAAGSTVGALAFSRLIDRYDAATTILVGTAGMALVTLTALLTPAVRRVRLLDDRVPAPAPDPAPGAETGEPSSV
jgi:predicted MFS family arabinose efflux permease